MTQLTLEKPEKPLRVKSRAPPKKLNLQVLIKLAAGEASLDLQGILAGPTVRMPSRPPLAPCKSREAALARSQLDRGFRV